MKVYSSFSNVINFERSCVDISSMYKRYAIMYDHVVFNRHGCPIGRGIFENLSQYVATLAIEPEKRSIGDFQKIMDLGNNPKFKELFIDLWELVDDPEKADKEARLCLKESQLNEIHDYAWKRNIIDKSMGIDNHHTEYKAAGIVAGDLCSELYYNFYLKSKIQDFNINFSPVVGALVEQVHNENNINDLFTSELVIPNFSELSWDQVLELRSDKYIKDFRKKVFECASIGECIDTTIAKELSSSLWDLADYCKPNTKKSMFEFVLSNIPMPTVLNPFSLYFGARDLKNENKAAANNSWVYFVQNFKQ